MAEPSSMILEAFERGGCGSPSLTCGACGRTHHAPGSDFIEPDEEKQMREDAEKNPDSVQLHDGDCVSGTMIGGIPVVRGCNCNWFGRLEAILWSERESILRYYQLRQEVAAKEVDRLGAALRAATETSAPRGPISVYLDHLNNRVHPLDGCDCTACDDRRTKAGTP